MKVDVFKYIRTKVDLVIDGELNDSSASICDFIFNQMNKMRADEIKFCARDYVGLLPYNYKTILSAIKTLNSCGMIEIVRYETRNNIPVIRFSNELYADKFKGSRFQKTEPSREPSEETSEETSRETLKNNITIISSNKLEDEIRVNDITRTPDFQIQKNEGEENTVTKRMQECDFIQCYGNNVNQIILGIQHTKEIAHHVSDILQAKNLIKELHDEFKNTNGAAENHLTTTNWIRHFQFWVKAELKRRTKESAQASLRPKTRAEFVAEVAKGIDDAYRAANQQPFAGQSEIDIEDADFQIIS